MKVPIELSRVLDRGGNPTVRELLSSIVFNPSNGVITLNGARIVMQRAAFSAELRRELIRLLGPQEARVFLIRLGYQSGQSDARFVRASWPNLDERDAFTAGTRLHTFSGVVRVETVFNTYDFRKKKLTAEFLWHESVEAAEFGGSRASSDPVCWTQLGYASGYASEFFGTLIVYKEVECAAQGHSHCRVIGKHADAWGASDPDVVMFRTRIAASSETASSEPMRKTNAALVERSLSDLDRALLAPVRAQLDHMAPMALPVLISGAPGTGRSQAARYLHRASAHAAPEMRYVFGAQVDLDLCAEIASPGKAGKRGEARRTILIDSVEDVPAALQPQLSRSIQEGVIHGGPRIIAISQDGPPDHVAALSTVLRTALSGLSIQMPRFSDRIGEMGDIASALLPILATRMGIEPPRLGDDALRYIESLAWTGNLLQMRSVLTGVLAANPGLASIGKTEVERQIAGGSFPEVATADAPVFDLVNRLMETQEFSVSDFEQSLYRTALARAGGNLAAAARSLGLTRAQLAYRLQTKNDTRPEPQG